MKCKKNTLFTKLKCKFNICILIISIILGCHFFMLSKSDNINESKLGIYSYAALINSIFYRHSIIWGGFNSTYVSWLCVPDPNWGALGNPMTVSKPDRPSQWDSDTEVLGYYYIDFDTGNDSGRTYGTPDSPRLTVPSGVQSGATLAYRIELAGTCTSAVNFYQWRTEAAPCWVVSDPANPVSFQPNGASHRHVYIRGQYIFFDGLDFDGNSATTNGPISIQTYTNTAADFTHHVCFRNCTVHDYLYGSNSAAIVVTAGSTTNYPDALTHDIVFYNNTIHTMGDWNNWASDQDFHGINLLLVNRVNNEEIYNVWDCGNTYYYLSGDSIQVNAERWATGTTEEDPFGREHIHHVYVAGNHSHHNRQSGGAFKQCVDVVFSQNHCHDMPKPAGTHGTGVMWLYNPDRVWILFNHIHDCITGMRQSTTNVESGWEADVYVIGNVIHDCFPDYVDGNTSEFYGNSRFKTGQAINFIHVNETRHVYYNTIYNCKGGISVNCTATTGSDVRHNIVMNIDEDNVTSANYDDGNFSFIYDAGYSGSFPTSNNYCGENVFYDESMTGSQYYLGSSKISSLSSFETSAGARAANNVEDNPDMTDPANDDFTLTGVSPALGLSGDRTAISDAFYTAFGTSLLYDYASNARSFDTDADAGALEYQG